MSRAGRARTAVLCALVLALVAACSASGVPAAPRTPAPVQAAWPGCEAVGAFPDDRGQPPSGTGGVPAGFTASRVVLCETDERANAAGATVSVELERTSTDVGPLLTYLSQPDGSPTESACTTDLWLPPWLFLVDDAGRYVAPAIPVDGCDKPLGWYDRDHDPLPWTSPAYTDRAVREGDVVESAEAKNTGCDMAYKDVVEVYANASHRLSGGFGQDPFRGQPLRTCVFEVAEADRGTDTPPGTFVSGRVLDDQQRAQVVAALAAARPTSPRCTEADARFALVGPKDGGPSVFVELDGCHRVVSDNQPTPVVRASDELLGLLEG